MLRWWNGRHEGLKIPWLTATILCLPICGGKILEVHVLMEKTFHLHVSSKLNLKVPIYEGPTFAMLELIIHNSSLQ